MTAAEFLKYKLTHCQNDKHHALASKIIPVPLCGSCSFSKEIHDKIEFGEE